MTVPSQENQVQDNKQADKEMNFRRLEARYQQELSIEKAKREEVEKKMQEISQKSHVEEEDDSEPYVDHKRLEKKLAKHGEQIKNQTQSEIQKAVHQALQDERKSNWLKSHSDFYQTLEHAEALALNAPDLAESILEMPESFERQKLVYKNIKALGLDKPQQKTPSIQEKIDANKRSPYYQPTGVGSAPYASASDFSQSGQKQAYDKMKELQSRLRL
jgi:actin-related protein